MVKRANGPRLLLESTLPVRFASNRCGQNLDSDLAADARIARSVDFPHAAGTERRKNFVGSEAAARHERHRRF
jgi:hypothetical protein